MFDPNLPTLSPNLIYQLTQLIQQLQIVSSPSQFETHQPPVLTSQNQNQVYWETSCPTPIIREPARTQGFESYCIPEVQEEDPEEKGIELNPEVVLDKLLTICLEALKWLPEFEKPESESNSPLKTNNGGDYLVKKDEKNIATKGAKIMGEIKGVEKTDKMDKMSESSFKIGIDIEKETLWNYQKPAKRNSKKNTWIKNRFEELTVIKERVNKDIKISKNNSAAVACRMDSNKEKKEEKGKKISGNSKIY
ncbi:28424_t:CDS:2 [Gigaspora margarita]|uniref:28424_t:CDS:1 n=1 Tax=Gigaspora margarita TaxID=4874 RepID=A0ABN7UWW8_GIGMA|nr:28424_t:CDS:2 [Gigaspora margarita]